jgi:hypothetical protein
MLGEIWKSFCVNDKRHYFTYDEKDIFRLSHKDYFNTNTESMAIFSGFKCNEYGVLFGPREKVILINSWYTIKNYFGDKSGKHKRNKNFYIYQGKIYNDQGEKIEKLSREAKKAYEEYEKTVTKGE